MDTQTEEKYRLIADLVADEYNPDHIERFRSHQEKYPHDGVLHCACQVWIATIYQMNGKTTEALNLYERLLDDHEQLGGYFASVLLNTLKLLVSEGQRDEAHAMFSRYLQSDELHNFARLALISWFMRLVWAMMSLRAVPKPFCLLASRAWSLASTTVTWTSRRRPGASPRR